MADRPDHNGAHSFVAVLGIVEGVLPFVAKLFGWHPLLALPLYLGSPWWWLVAGSVVAACAILLERIDKAAKRTRDPSA